MLFLLLLPPHTLLPCGLSPCGKQVLQNFNLSSSMGCSFSLIAPAWVPCKVTGHKFCQEAFSSVGFPQGHSLLQVSASSTMGPSRSCRGISAPLWSCRSTACYSMVFIMGCRAISTLVPEASPAPLFSDLRVCRAASLPMFSLLSLAVVQQFLALQ